MATYIGLDVHSASTTVVAVNAKGKTHRSSRGRGDECQGDHRRPADVSAAPVCLPGGGHAKRVAVRSAVAARRERGGGCALGTQGSEPLQGRCARRSGAGRDAAQGQDREARVQGAGQVQAASSASRCVSRSSEGLDAYKESHQGDVPFARDLSERAGSLRGVRARDVDQEAAGAHARSRTAALPRVRPHPANQESSARRDAAGGPLAPHRRPDLHRAWLGPDTICAVGGDHRSPRAISNQTSALEVRWLWHHHSQHWGLGAPNRRAVSGASKCITRAD